MDVADYVLLCYGIPTCIIRFILGFEPYEEDDGKDMFAVLWPVILITAMAYVTVVKIKEIRNNWRRPNLPRAQTRNKK